VTVADAVSIHYSRDVGWSGALIVELCRAAPSTVLVTFNYDMRPEIGVYRTTLAEGVFLQVLEEVRRSNYASLAPAGPLQPETKCVVIGERLDGDDAPGIHAFDESSFPPGLGPLQAHLESVAADIRRHASRTVEGSAAWTKPAFFTDEPIAARISLKNAGVLPVTLANPLSSGREAGVQLLLKNAAGATESVDLAPAQLRAPAGHATDGMVTLAPGGALAFELRKVVYLEPGDYLGRVAYRSLVDVQGDPQFVEGELWLELGAIGVRHRGPS
jgi:hypothetical protein